MSTTPGDNRPLAVRVYEGISTDIINGEIPAGSTLVQDQLGIRFGVSRTPVRDALTRLTHEGLATLHPGQGYVVNDLTDQDVEQVYEVRRVLETLAARQACGHHTPLQILRLKALIDESELLGPDDPAAQFQLSRRFHTALVEPCANGYLRGILETVWEHPIQQRITMTYEQGPARLATVTADHRSIVEALERNDPDTVAEVLRGCHDPYDDRNPRS